MVVSFCRLHGCRLQQSHEDLGVQRRNLAVSRCHLPPRPPPPTFPCRCTRTAARRGGQQSDKHRVPGLGWIHLEAYTPGSGQTPHPSHPHTQPPPTPPPPPTTTTTTLPPFQLFPHCCCHSLPSLTSRAGAPLCCRSSRPDEVVPRHSGQPRRSAGARAAAAASILLTHDDQGCGASNQAGVPASCLQAQVLPACYRHPFPLLHNVCVRARVRTCVCVCSGLLFSQDFHVDTSVETGYTPWVIQCVLDPTGRPDLNRPYLSRCASIWTTTDEWPASLGA